MDIFPELRRQLADSGREVFHLHQGKLYANPNPRLDFGADSAFIIEPQVHSDEGGQAVLLERVRDLFIGPQPQDRHIALANGGTNAIWLAMKVAIDPRRPRVHVLAPYWMYLPGVIRHAGGEMDEVPVIDEQGAFADARVLQMLRDRMDHRSSVVYVASPANPLGNLLSDDLLRGLVALCEERDAHLIVDHACYAFTCNDEPGRGIPKLPPVYRHPRIINAFTFSKLLGVAGLRLGFLQGSADNIAKAGDLYRYSSYTLNSYSQSVVYAYLGQPELLATRQAQYAENREIYRVLVPRPGLFPSGGMFGFLPLPAGVSARQIIAAGIGVVPGHYFGADYGNWVRICFTAEPPDRLRRAVQSLKALIKE